MSDPDPFDENRRGPARLSDREFVQLLVDLGEIALPITPETRLTEWEVRYVLEQYHADRDHSGMAAPIAGQPLVPLHPVRAPVEN